MRGSRRSKAIALLGSASVLGALLVAAPSVRATAIIDTISLSANQPWSLAADSDFVYVGVSNSSSYVVKVNPTSGTFSNINTNVLGVSGYSYVTRGSAAGNWLYASLRTDDTSATVVRMNVVDDTTAARQAFPFSLSDIAVKSTNGVDDTLYVGFGDGPRGGVLLLDPVSLGVDDSIPLPRFPGDIALVGDDSIIVTPSGATGSREVYIINARNTDDSIRIPFVNPRGVAVSPDNQWAYITAEDNFNGQPYLSKISTRTGLVDFSISLPSTQGFQVAVAANDGTAYVTTGDPGQNARRVIVLPQGSVAGATSVALSGAAPNTPDMAGGGVVVSPSGRAYVGTVASGNGQLEVLGSLAPPPAPSPTPATPPGAPTDVVATSGWKSVTVDWSAPAVQGSFPITTYLVKASPGGQMCLARRSDANPTQCTLTTLTPGTQYTFRVQALNGGGWGAESAASNAATPQDLRITSQQRKPRTFLGIRVGSEVRVSGTAVGYPAQTRVDLWIKLGAAGQWVQQTDARVTTDYAGRYSWGRNFGRNKDGTPIGVRFSIAGNFSNEVTLPPLR